MAAPEIRPASASDWRQLDALFRGSPSAASCWCIWPRVPRGAMWTRSAEQNEAEFRALVDGGVAPGLLAFLDGDAVGWCSVAPCADCARFADAATDGAWAIACLFLAPGHRGQGVAPALLRAATAYAEERGARELLALPRDWRPDEAGGVERLLRLLKDAGFRETPAGSAFLMRTTIEPRWWRPDEKGR